MNLYVGSQTSTHLKRTDWDSYIKHLSNNMAHLDVGAYIREEIELETIQLSG